MQPIRIISGPAMRMRKWPCHDIKVRLRQQCATKKSSSLVKIKNKTKTFQIS